MATTSTNPFDDFTDASPFEDPSVTAVSKAHHNALQDQYNPYENAVFSSASKDDQPAEPCTPSSPSSPFSLHVSHAEYLHYQQEELERKAAALERREQTLQTQISEGSNSGGRINNNFPPLPSGFPIKPCFYQNISVEIPEQYRRIVRLNYCQWIAFCILRFISVWVCLAYFFVSKGSDSAQAGLTLILAFVWLIVHPPLVYIFFFRAVYNAFRTNAAIYFLVYIVICFLHFCDNVVSSIGIRGSGNVGFISGFFMITDKDDKHDHGKSVSSHTAMGITMVVMGVLFAILAAINMMTLLRVIYLFRSTGITTEMIQQEIARDIARNRTVQQTTSTVVTSAVQSAVHSNAPQFNTTQYNSGY